MPATERARRFMCSVCGGRAKGKKLPPKAVACEQCRAGIKKELRDELEHEPPTKRFLVKYATALASHLPAIVVQDAMRKARGHAGGTGKVKVIKAALSAAERKKLPKSAFAIPEKAPGPGSYPIHDEAHARAALQRVSQFGTPEEKARVRAAVKRKYPDIEISKSFEPDSDDVHVNGLLRTQGLHRLDSDIIDEDEMLCKFESEEEDES